MELVQIMKQVEIFQELTDTQLESISKISKQEAYAKGETICSQGSPGDRMYIISSGQVEIVIRDGKGHTYSALFLGTGQVVGEMALIDQGARSATVIAAEPETIVYSIPTAEFTQLCQEDTAIGYVMMRNLAMDLSFKLRHRDFDPSVT